MPNTRKAERTESYIQYLNLLAGNVTQGSNMHTALQRLIELKQQRARDLDNNLGFYNEKKYLEDYKAALENVVNILDDGEVPAQVMEGFRTQITAIENGWGAEELDIFAFLGETKANLENPENINAIIDNDFQEEFDELYNSIAETEVYSRREKVNHIQAVIGFINKYPGNAGFFSQSLLLQGNNKEEVLNDFTDSESMEGQSKEEQLSGIMQDLDAVDGTFQHSSDNFRELRKRLEELNALARKYTGEMTREQLDEYLSKVEEVKAAADKYLKGKNTEILQYKQRHRRSPELKEITKKRMSFAMGLEERLSLHLENCVPQRFKEDVSFDSTEYSMALMARRMRAEDKVRKELAPKKSIDANHAFLKSVYRSLYIESVRSRFLTVNGGNPDGLELKMESSQIREGAQQLARKYKSLGLEAKLLENINHRIEIGETDFGREFILAELDYGMQFLGKTKPNPDILQTKESVLASFGYEDREADAFIDGDGKLGFGRYLVYSDRDPQSKVSKTENLEKKLGISPSGPQPDHNFLDDFEVIDNIEGNGINAGEINRVNAVNSQFLATIDDGKLSEEQLRENVVTYLMNVYKVERDAKQPLDANAQFSIKKRFEDKEALMKSAVKTLVNTMNLSDMDGKTLKEYLRTATENGIIGEMVKNSEAVTDSVFLNKRRYEEEFERVEFVRKRLNTTYTNLKAGERKDLFKSMVDDLQTLEQMLTPMIKNPNIKLDSATYLEIKDRVVEKLIDMEDSPYMQEFGYELDGHIFASDIRLMNNALQDQDINGGPNYQKHQEITEEVRNLDSALAQANRNFLQTGVYPNNRIKNELKIAYNKLDQMFREGNQAKAYTDLSRFHWYVKSPMEKADKAYSKAKLDSDFNEESKQRAQEYREMIMNDQKLKQEAEEEERFLNDKHIINLTVDTVIKPEEKASDTMKTMIRKEETLRARLIKDYLKDGIKAEEKNAVFDKIVASACRSLYMEMLKSRYEDETKVLDEAAQKKNEADYHKAISLGFKDKLNMMEFANLMKEGDFGKIFKTNLKDRIQNNLLLTQEDIKKARDYALVKDYEKAIPPYVKNEKGDYVPSDKPSDFVKADNIRVLALALGSHSLDSVQNLPFPINKNEKSKLRDLQVVTDYSTKAPVKAPKAGLVK